jgi:membrane protein DedA with SNARE-associated domain
MEQFFLTVFEFFTGLGVLGIALGLMIEIIPSEIVLGYGGYLISKGEVGFFWAAVAGIVGGTIAQLFLYWAGSFGGRPFLEKYGKYIFIQSKHLDISEKWFQNYGPIVIFTARFIPVVRHAISIPAGIAKMRFLPFFLYTVAAVIPWTILFLYIGFQLGENWREVKEVAQPLVVPIMILIILGAITYFVFERKRG